MRSIKARGTMNTIALWTTIPVLTAAVYTDIKCRRISNRLVLPFLTAGIVVSTIRCGLHGSAQSIEAIGLAMMLVGVPAIFGMIGFGDAKLCAAIGAWIGPMQLLVALFVTAIAGGILAIGWTVATVFSPAETPATAQDNGAPQTSASGVGTALRSGRHRSIPYAPAIAVGTLLSFLTH